MNTSDSTPLRVAIIGGGPSGFFIAGHFLKTFEEVDVHLFEREAMPYGLVRYGIAPDHQHTKKVTKVFEKTGRDSRFHFHGHVEIGRDLDITSLRQAADIVIAASGHDRERPLGIPGEELSISAVDWVNWYNCHPAHSETVFRWQGDTGVVVGNGNVAMDIVRLLGKAPEDIISTDINPDAVATFKQQPLKRLVILGRRGPAQASFKVPELRELMAMDTLELVVDPAELALNEASVQELALPENREHQKVVSMLEEISCRPPRPDARCRIEFQFLRSPLSIEAENGQLRLKLSRNGLDGAPGQQVCRPSGEEETLEAGLVVKAIGYLGSEIPGLPFDRQRCRIPTRQHQVIDEAGAPLHGVYASGWIKTGPQGLLGNSRQDAKETFKKIASDLAEGKIPIKPRSTGMAAILKSQQIQDVSWSNWQALDEAELILGEKSGKKRKKFRNNLEALAYLKEGEIAPCPEEDPDNL